ENRQCLLSLFSLNFSITSTASAYRTLATGSSSSLARARGRATSIRSCPARYPWPCSSALAQSAAATSPRRSRSPHWRPLVQPHRHHRPALRRLLLPQARL